MLGYIAIFLILHGLVHLWYVTLSSGLVEYQPEIGWTSESWIFTNILGQATVDILAVIMFSVAAVAFVISGIILLTDSHLWRVAIVSSAIYSSLILFFFWDGKTTQLVQKGLIGVILNIIIIVGALRK